MNLAKADNENLKPGERFALANLYLEMDKYDDAIDIYNLLNEATQNGAVPGVIKEKPFIKAEIADTKVTGNGN